MVYGVVLVQLDHGTCKFEVIGPYNSPDMMNTIALERGWRLQVFDKHKHNMELARRLMTNGMWKFDGQSTPPVEWNGPGMSNQLM